MEFGIFSQMHCPPWDDEHSRYLRELEVSLAVEDAGFKYDWSPEHHFLQHYSHQPAPEVFLSWVAARTKRIHVGTAITNITRAVNHPARVAERIATMDHLSEGRVEFGTGRGSSSAEWGGFAIPSAAETKPMWRESLEQIPRMWADEPYAFDGKYFRMPERNVLPKPYSKPHPPMWVACSSPPTFVEAGELGLGSLCFTFGTPSEIAEHVRNYKEAIKRCKKPIGGYVNDNIAVTTNMFCLEDGDKARHLYSGAKVEFPEDDAAFDEETRAKLIEKFEEIYRLVGEKQPGISDMEFGLSFRIAQNAGLNLAQRIELLAMRSERARQEYLLAHIEKAIKAVREQGGSKSFARGNGKPSGNGHAKA